MTFPEGWDLRSDRTQYSEEFQKMKYPVLKKLFWNKWKQSSLKLGKPARSTFGLANSGKAKTRQRRKDEHSGNPGNSCRWATILVTLYAVGTNPTRWISPQWIEWNLQPRLKVLVLGQRLVRVIRKLRETCHEIHQANSSPLSQTELLQYQTLRYQADSTIATFIWLYHQRVVASRQ